jgi:hypothetical protein
MVREMNSHGLKDGSGYRVSDAVGLENVGSVIAHFLQTSDILGTIHRTLNHNDTTMNNNRLTTDLQVHTKNQESKQIELDVLPLGEYLLRMHRTSFQIHVSTITLQTCICSVR